MMEIAIIIWYCRRILDRYLNVRFWEYIWIFKKIFKVGSIVNLSFRACIRMFSIFFCEIFFDGKILWSSFDRHQKFDYEYYSCSGNWAQFRFWPFRTIFGIFLVVLSGKSLGPRTMIFTNNHSNLWSISFQITWSLHWPSQIFLKV